MHCNKRHGATAKKKKSSRCTTSNTNCHNSPEHSTNTCCEHDPPINCTGCFSLGGNPIRGYMDWDWILKHIHSMHSIYNIYAYIACLKPEFPFSIPSFVSVPLPETSFRKSVRNLFRVLLCFFDPQVAIAA